MVRKDIVEDIVSYFKSDQWQKFMRMLTKKDDPMYHIHVYVENRVHQESLANLLTAYHKLKGVPLDRGIKFACTPSVAYLLNVQPTDAKTSGFLANYEIFWSYNPNVILAPMELKPDGDLSQSPTAYKELQDGNLFGWGKKFMDNYLKQFDFKCVGPNEEQEIRRYFKSDHFKKWLRLTSDPIADHIHCNVEINFDPGILKMYAEEALKEMGLKIDWVIPNVFRVPSGYRGKLIFLCAYPEWQHDICWDYNPDVVVRPATKPFIGFRHPPDGDINGDITFDIAPHFLLEAMMAKGEYVELTDEEINEILARV